MILRTLITSIALVMMITACANGQTTSDNDDAEIREFLSTWNIDITNRVIELSELKPGGPPQDGIPSIDNPQFVSIEEAQDWLNGSEPVIRFEHDGEVRAYPLQILMFHEIVNDEFGEMPVAVTFCPLCYSAVVVDRRLDGDVLEFGVSGLLRHSDLVMFDRQTESLWQQISGRGLVGDYAGAELDILPAQIISFAQFREAHPEAPVLSRTTGHERPYGQNPYAGYDDVESTPLLMDGEVDDRLPPMEIVVTLEINGEAKAYPHSITSERGVIHDEVGGESLVVFHSGGAVSALDQRYIADSREVGSTGVFRPHVDGRELTFSYNDDYFVDQETGSRWNITGQAVSGELEGAQLEQIPHGDYFSFAWFAFQPETAIYQE